MVYGRTMIKRKRRDCSPILDESPKRTKVQAQRKFAQGSNVNSPVITPVKELEMIERSPINIMPEPVELLPIKRPNTEDFLTFLCFRGTPILPPNLNFFNTASIVDTNGQVHKIKGESPKNGPIDASVVKCGTSADKPFIAFGVRKRADPIVISKQMDKKRRHALAIQALRRKYQEQKMAKIRAITISKLSEKVTNKTSIRTNPVKTETVIKKTNTIQKTKVKVVSTKLVTTLRPKGAQKMCLRSFRGKYVHKELPFRSTIEKRKILPDKKMKKIDKKPQKDTTKKEKPLKAEARLTRSGHPINSNKTKLNPKQENKKRLIFTTLNNQTVKPRSLRSTTLKKTVVSQKKNLLKNKKDLMKKQEKEDVKKLRSGSPLKSVPDKILTRRESTRITDTKKEIKIDKKTGKKEIKFNQTCTEKKKLVKKESEDKAEKKTMSNLKKNVKTIEKKLVKKQAEEKKPKEDEKKPIKETEKKQSKEEEKKEEGKKKEEKDEVKKEDKEAKTQRPSRKTKEAAAIYMEILSHKLVNDSKIDDDNVSIDSFPELPNVKRMEARENELKAKAKQDKPIRRSKRSSDVVEKEDKELEEDEAKKMIDKIIEAEISAVMDPKKKKLKEKEDPKEKLEEAKKPRIEETKKPDKTEEKRNTRTQNNPDPDKIEKEIDSESDKSDIDLSTLRKQQKAKITKKAFSDSDEEPLSKYTVKSDSQVSKKQEAKNEPVSRSRRVEKIEKKEKPKRECAKRPQNYLMFSSSDEEEDFFGQDQPKLEPKSSDLLTKDVSRRFGKEKVNMSNEQIEKWLKESALAGGKREDEPKFGELIPTETSFEMTDSLDTQKLEDTLLKPKHDSKTPKNLLDRKLIFRKDKSTVPNVNAFSPENESSVYAFGEESEPVGTPFRRPSRRPSSTTSRSEDEEKFRMPPVKDEEDKFYMPLPKAKPNKAKVEKKKDFDDFKYKIPSSPSASSSSSAKLYKNKKQEPIQTLEFPKTSPAQLCEAPIFRPTEQEFQDPIEYIERIRSKAEQFGICKIIPPSTFKPECKVTDDMRFTAYNQYVHKMLHRWGPNFKELMAIRKYLETQNISLNQPPWIGGMEIDLPRLYQTVQSLGGLKEVIEKKKWPKVSESMKIPKSAQDRVTKLDDIYCKYLLPYDTLSPLEREKLFDEVETEWAKRESKSFLKAQSSDQDLDESDEDDDEVAECIVKGRSMALNAFYRIARNTMAMHFRTSEPKAEEVEQEFWKHVTLKQNHICVHSGSIDCGNWGYGFAVSKNSPFARHAWNLKVLTNNSGSVLRSLGPLMGVTVPTLHVGMVFSACCWYRDPHGLPWIEYLHTGGSKIWYAIPNSASDNFHKALKKLVPSYCKNKALWLPSDTAMIPPDLLVSNNVSLCRTVQEPGQFVVVFPKAFTSSISTGYVVSESVYYAPPYWLKTAKELFEELRNSSEPCMFSLERLLISIAVDSRSNVDILKQILPDIKEIVMKEKNAREKISKFGIKNKEKLPLPEVLSVRKKKRSQDEEVDYECEMCRMNLFLSQVYNEADGASYCLEHSFEILEKKEVEVDGCKFMFTYDDDELEELVGKIEAAIESKSVKKAPSKFAGMPTLLK